MAILLKVLHKGRLRDSRIRMSKSRRHRHKDPHTISNSHLNKDMDIRPHNPAMHLRHRPVLVLVPRHKRTCHIDRADKRRVLHL
jgi:hypothetical protein